MGKPVIFETDVVEKAVKLHSASDNSLVDYVIREMSGAQKEKYLNAVRQKSRIADNGDIIVEDYEGMFTELLHFCMYTMAGDPVERKDMVEWPARVLMDLSNIAKKLNALTVEDAKRMMEEAKND
jgi:hypothetical protein